MKLKVSIVGARRIREGTGPFLAKFFFDSGCNVTSILGKSLTTSNIAKKELFDKFGLQVNNYTKIEDLLKSENPDIVVIASPKETHYNFIKKSLENHSNVFCEKPLIWQKQKINYSNYIKKVKSLIDLSNKNKCLLQLTNQWPYTIQSFCNIFNLDKIKNINIETFSMELTIAKKLENQLRNTLVECLPHHISMVEKLCGYGEFEKIKFYHSDKFEKKHIIISSYFKSKKGVIKNKLIINFSNKKPRPASYTINEKKVIRLISLVDNYQIYFKKNKDLYKIIDPMKLSVQNFLNNIKKNKIKTNLKSLIFQMKSLHNIVSKYKV